MGVFEDMSRLLEERLDEFLKTHPGLELQVLEDQLREQEAEVQKNLRQLAAEEQEAQQNILKTAEEVQRWHGRIAKAEQAKRPDLAQAAREREAAFLRQGNQQWAQMSLAQQQIQQYKALAEQVQSRRQDVRAKIRQQAQSKVPQTPPTPQAWQETATRPDKNFFEAPDPLEARFKELEMEQELDALKRQMGK
ncbi:TIGR04376 family protein [Altericista sp. CCNU0014]|uniref:TIGR04376 family protein n=1 Tax=Altericista sp. CCNU0014 TaxID=3082949 RepID=UPI003850B229